MTTRRIFMATALLACGTAVGSLEAAAKPAAPPVAQRHESAGLHFPKGFEQVQIPHVNEKIEARLAEVVQSIKAGGNFARLTDSLTDWNRDRVDQFFNHDPMTELNGVAAQVRADWKSKYGHDFDFEGHQKQMFDGYVAILPGRVVDVREARVNWPLPATGQRAWEPNGQAVQAGQRVVKSGTGGELEFLPDHRVAAVQLPPRAGLPALTLSLYHAPPDEWRVDVPEIQGRQLEKELSAQLTEFARNVDHWPRNETDAYRLAAHRIFMALYHLPAQPKAVMKKK